MSSFLDKINEKIPDNNNGRVKPKSIREAFKITEQKIGEISSGVLGSITTTQTLAELNALEDGVYRAQTSGYYANGYIAKQGFITTFRKTGNVWTLENETELPRGLTTGVISNHTDDFITIDSLAGTLTTKAETIFLTYGSDLNFKLYSISAKTIPFEGALSGLAYLLFSKATNDFLVATHSVIDSKDANDYLLISVFSIAQSQVYSTTSTITFNNNVVASTMMIPSLSTGLNLLNGNYSKGYMALDGSGQLVSDANGRVSDFIFVKGQKKIYSYVERTKGYALFYGFYDANKVAISGGMAIGTDERKGEYPIPTNAVYLRQGIVAINETKKKFDDCYISFYPYPNKITPPVLQYGEPDGKSFEPGKISRPPIDLDDPINLATLQQYAGVNISGKVYLSLGDSITAPSDSYASVIARNFNFEWHNLGVAGCHWTNYDDTIVDFSGMMNRNELANKWATNVIQNQVYRVLQMITATNVNVPETSSSTQFHNDYTYPVKGTGLLDASKVELVTIACGTNDASNGKPIGTFEAVNLVDYTLLDRKTMWSVMKWTINVLRKYLPNAKIVIIAPIQRENMKVQLWEYVKMEIEASNMLGCPCLNAFNEVGIMQEIEAVEHRYLYDGLHPNSKGNELYGAYVSSKLFSLYKF